MSLPWSITRSRVVSKKQLWPPCFTSGTVGTRQVPYSLMTLKHCFLFLIVLASLIFFFKKGHYLKEEEKKNLPSWQVYDVNHDQCNSFYSFSVTI